MKAIPEMFFQTLLIKCFKNILAKTLLPTALKGCQGIVFTHGVRIGWRSGWLREKVCTGCISETIRCRKCILGRDIGWGCRCVMSWSDLDLAFYLATVTMSLKILSGLYLGNRKV